MPDAPTWTVTINAPADKVWPLVADVGKHADWSPKAYRMEWLAGEPNAVGSTFRSHGWLPNDKDHQMEGRVTVNEPMTRFEVVSSPPMKGFGKIAFSIAFPLVVRPGVQKGMDMLKAKAEGSA